MDHNTEMLVAAQLAAALLGGGSYKSADPETAAIVYYRVVEQLRKNRPKADSFFSQ